MVWPPSRAIATVKLTRVRVDALRKISPSTRPAAWGRRRPPLMPAASRSRAFVPAASRSAEER